MKMFSITTDGHLLASDQFTVEEYLNSTFAAAMQIFSDITRRQPEEDQAKTKEELYDMFNTAASSFLEAWIPNNLRPDLTEEAILRMENQILDEEVTDNTIKFVKE